MPLRHATCLSLLISVALVSTAHAATIGRELVDDGTCPAGQLKEVRGAKMTDKGVSRTSSCVPRHGPKTK